MHGREQSEVELFQPTAAVFIFFLRVSITVGYLDTESAGVMC